MSYDFWLGFGIAGVLFGTAYMIRIMLFFQRLQSITEKLEALDRIDKKFREAVRKEMESGKWN